MGEPGEVSAPVAGGPSAGGPVGGPGKKKAPMRTIARRLAFWFLLIALLPLGAVLGVFYALSVRDLEHGLREHLLAVTDAKDAQIETYARERQRDVGSLARSPDVIRATLDLCAAGGVGSAEHGRAVAAHRGFFASYCELKGYDDLFLVSPAGDVVLSVRGGELLGTNFYTGPHRSSEAAKVVDRAKTLLESEISDFDSTLGGSPAAFVASPVFLEGKVVGVLALRINNDEIYAVVNDVTGLGATGETVVATRVGSEAVCVTPLRHDPQAAFRRRITLGSAEMVMLQQAVGGRKGTGLTVDYRNRQVVGMWRYLPSLRWGMVVKIDADEAFALIHQQRRIVLLIVLLVVLGVTGAALMVSRSITAPVDNLMRGVEVVAGGNLQHTVPVISFDEFGHLTHSFNKMTRDLREIYATIEQRVQDATADLQKALVELKSTQGHLVQSEKMASLGQMVAGVAHEINNPINFITGAAENLGAKIQELEQFLLKLMGDDAAGELGQEVQTRVQRLRQDVATIGNGADRVKRIVKGLRSFSRLDEAEYKEVDLHEGIDSTLEILQFKLKDVAVVKDYGKLPLVECHASQINQVIMNLVVNGIQALETREGGKGTVTIRTRTEGADAVVTVKDDGCGIPPDKIGRIFDPFYTTKPVGQGTGLGLSISFGILQAHGGRIDVESTPGVGTSFHVRLPIARTASAAPVAN